MILHEELAVLSIIRLYVIRYKVQCAISTTLLVLSELAYTARRFLVPGSVEINRFGFLAVSQ